MPAPTQARIAAAALGSVLLIWSPVAAAATCPTGPNGRWIVKDEDAPGVIAMTNSEARRIRHNPVFVSDTLVVFAGKRCRVSNIDKGPKDHSFDDLISPEKWPGFETGYSYLCSDDVDIPDFWVGPSCDAILVSQDGVTFRLVRAGTSGAKAPDKARHGK